MSVIPAPQVWRMRRVWDCRKGCFLKGGRVQLGEALTNEICKEREPRKITPFTTGIEAKRANAVRSVAVADYLAPRYRKNRENVLGCNMSFFRDDFMAVNGYDESFEGWGAEDLDISFRFKNMGLGKRYLKFCALAYHLWHREAQMDKSSGNHAVARKHRDEGVVRASKGVDQY